MLVVITRSGFWAISILNISDGYPNAFLYVKFLACLSICMNTTFPKLNFLFMPTWKSKVEKLFNTVVRWVVGNQLHMAILCRIEYMEVR